MATSLNAHIEREKQGREFLMDTISDIPHQLKTPLTALQMYSDFITLTEMEGKRTILRCDNSIALCFDEIWLGEAVGNIIKNALDHTEDNNQIEISCAETVITTEITVKDNGSGILPEDIHHIFKRFYRSRNSKDRQDIGIGLALAKTIVEQHGGSITVQSEFKNGTAFHLIFPKLSNL